jgi:hypothetical protein
MMVVYEDGDLDHDADESDDDGGGVISHWSGLITSTYIYSYIYLSIYVSIYLFIFYLSIYIYLFLLTICSNDFRNLTLALQFFLPTPSPITVTSY